MDQHVFAIFCFFFLSEIQISLSGLIADHHVWLTAPRYDSLLHIGCPSS